MLHIEMFQGGGGASTVHGLLRGHFLQAFGRDAKHTANVDIRQVVFRSAGVECSPSLEIEPTYFVGNLIFEPVPDGDTLRDAEETSELQPEDQVAPFDVGRECLPKLSVKVVSCLTAASLPTA